MGIDVIGLEEMEVLIRQSGEKAQRGVSAQMKREAEKIRDLARKFAPIDHGNLEEAIDMAEVESERGESGRFGRKSYSVFVDMFYPSHDGRSVGDYAYVMHEHLMPYGPYKLGEHSRAKQAGQIEMVGGMYLERAVDEVSRDMMTRLANVARSYL